MKTVSFNLDSKVSLAWDFVVHEVRGRHLLLVANRPTWIVLNNAEYFAFNALLDGATLRNTLLTHNDHTVRLLMSKVEHAGFYTNHMSSKKVRPSAIVIHVTNRCNLRCVHCYVDAGKALSGELNIEEWLSVIDQYGALANSGEVVVSGGEPTLMPNLDLLLTEIRSRGHRIVLFTNGATNGGRSGWPELAKMVDLIQLSLDGFTPEINDDIRGRGSFAKIMRTYDALYGTGTPLNLAVCVTPQNASSVARDLIPFLQKHDPEKKLGLGLSPTITSGRNADGSHSFSYFDLQHLVGDILSLLWSKGWPIPKNLIRNEMQIRCGIGSSIVIKANGDYQACTRSPILGNIHRARLQDLYRHAQQYAESFNIDNQEQCKMCDVRYLCLRKCPFEALPSESTCSRRRRYYYELLVRESAALFKEDGPGDTKGGELDGRREGCFDC